MTLPEDALAFAEKVFDLVRTGGAAEQLAEYVDHGLPVDLTNAQGNTLLMLATYNGNLPETKVLLDRGADPNKLNDRGQTPLAGAVFKGYREIVQELVEKGADPKLGVPSALDSALMFDRKEMMEIFGA